MTISIRLLSMALAMSAHTLRCNVTPDVRTSWHFNLGQDTPSRYLAIRWKTCKSVVIGSQLCLPNQALDAVPFSKSYFLLGACQQSPAVIQECCMPT